VLRFRLMVKRGPWWRPQDLGCYWRGRWARKCPRCRLWVDAVEKVENRRTL